MPASFFKTAEIGGTNNMPSPQIRPANMGQPKGDDNMLEDNNLENIAREIADAFSSEIKEARTDGRAGCNKCQNGARGFGEVFDCPLCASTGFCDAHLTRHVCHRHPGTEEYEASLLLITQEHMLKGWVTGLYTREEVYTLDGVVPNTWGRSTYFDNAEHAGIPFPCVVTWKVGKTDKDKARLRPQVLQFLDMTGLMPYSWTTRSGLTIWAGQPSEVQYLPDISLDEEEQVSASGLVFSKKAKAGKVAKRLGEGSITEGALWAPFRSTITNIKFKEDLVVKTTVVNTGGTGDGNGAIRESVAYRLLREAGITKRRQGIFGFYCHIVTSDYFFKGFVIIHPEETFPSDDRNIGLVVDEASLSTDVLDSNWTRCKIIPYRTPNHDDGVVQIEWLMQGETFSGFTNPEEIAEQMVASAHRLDDEVYRTAMNKHRERLAGSQEDEEEEEEVEENSLTTEEDRPDAEETLHWDGLQEENIHLNRAKARPEAQTMVQVAMEASHGSPYANPHVTKQLVGRVEAGWRSRKDRMKNGRKSKMPMVMVSGDEVILASAFYAGVPEPPPGYLTLVWRNGHAVIACPNGADFIAYNRAMDTWDNDSDKLTLPYLRWEDGSYGTLALRRPMSVDGGAEFKLLDKDVTLLLALGRRFNQKTGGHRWPGLHETDAQGKPNKPDVLTAIQLEDQPTWMTRYEDFGTVLEMLIGLKKFTSAIGQASNLTGALDMSGCYNPEEVLYNLSDGIIDPTQNATSDPTPITEGLAEALYRKIRERHPIDSCIYDRIERDMKARHQANPDRKTPELLIRTTCAPHHKRFHNAATEAVEYMTQRLRQRQLMAHGPVEGLLKEHDEMVTAIVADAYAVCRQAWRDCKRKEDEISKDRDLGHHQKETARAVAMNRARDTELEATNRAYREASQLPQYVDGSFVGLWMQLDINCRRRFDKDPIAKPVTLMALTDLPEKEHWAHYAQGPSEPTVIVRTWHNPTEARRVGLTPGRLVSVRETGKGQFWLVSDGKAITKVRADAKAFLNWPLEVIGHLPNLQAANCNQVQLPPPSGKKETPSHTLALQLAGTNPKFQD